MTSKSTFVLVLTRPSSGTYIMNAGESRAIPRLMPFHARGATVAPPTSSADMPCVLQNFIRTSEPETPEPFKRLKLLKRLKPFKRLKLGLGPNTGWATELDVHQLVQCSHSGVQWMRDW